MTGKGVDYSECAKCPQIGGTRFDCLPDAQDKGRTRYLEHIFRSFGAFDYLFPFYPHNPVYSQTYVVLEMAPSRTASTRDSRKTSLGAATRPSKGRRSGSKAKKQSSVNGTQPEPARYLSCHEVLVLLTQTATKLLPLQDEPFEKPHFEDGTSIAARIEWACKYRDIDPSIFRPITYLTNDGNKVSSHSI